MTITTEEVQALLELAGRAPMSRIEALWFQMVVQRWNDSQRVAAEAAEDVGRHPGAGEVGQDA